MPKNKKRKQVYKETYVKGTTLEDIPLLIEFLRQPGIVVNLIAAGTNDDDTEFWQITVDGIVPPPPPTNKKKNEPNYNPYKS